MKNFIAFFACLFLINAQAQTYTPTPGNLAARTAFQDRKFGMFIHWGASSVLGDGEWVMENHGIQATDYKKLVKLFNPTQFDAEIAGKKDIVLTLSGHTHAAQLGIKIGKHLFSPASLIFKYWAGLYKVNNQYIYVNRGIGYIGLPMHIGVRPEITVIVLNRK